MRSRRIARRIVLFCATGLLGACASASPPPPEWGGPAAPPPVTYGEAMAALAAGDHVEGRAKLAQVLEVCGTTALGEQATVALIADAMDPRNPDLDLAATLSRAYLSQPYRTPQAEQFAASAYLVSMDIGGALDESLSILPSADPVAFPAECQSGLSTPTYRGLAEIPAPPSQSMANRLAELERAIDEFELTIEQLETELARVRETLRP